MSRNTTYVRKGHVRTTSKMLPVLTAELILDMPQTIHSDKKTDSTKKENI